MTLIEKVEDLIVQATKERSHYYVKSVCVEVLEALRAAELLRSEPSLCIKCAGPFTFDIDVLAQNTIEALHAENLRLREALERLQQKIFRERQLANQFVDKEESDCATYYIDRFHEVERERDSLRAQAERLAVAGDGIIELIDDMDLVRNTQSDAEFLKFMDQGIRITTKLKALQEALQQYRDGGR